MGRFRFPGRSTFIGGRTPAQGAPPSAVEALPRLARTEECEAPAAQCAVCSLPHITCELPNFRDRRVRARRALGQSGWTS
jgi:hypothetical protein